MHTTVEVNGPPSPPRIRIAHMTLSSLRELLDSLNDHSYAPVEKTVHAIFTSPGKLFFVRENEAFSLLHSYFASLGVSVICIRNV